MAEQGFELTREFAASRERVWAEWTTPAAFADWFGGTAFEVPVESVIMDVRPGGTWQATMYVGPERAEKRWAGEYLEVSPPARLVLTMTDDPASELRELVTIEILDLGDGRTRMRLEQRGGMTAAQYRAGRAGWDAFFDRMEQRLRSRRADPV
jgi:uncharacterized protein YndB with AHSA1/START domain